MEQDKAVTSAGLGLIMAMAPLTALAAGTPTASGTGVGTDKVTVSGSANAAAQTSGDATTGGVHLSYSTVGGAWHDSGDKQDHDNGTFLVTIPKEIRYENMRVGKVETSDTYDVWVRGSIPTGATVSLTVASGVSMGATGSDTITEKTSKVSGGSDTAGEYGKDSLRSFTASQVFAGVDADGSVQGTHVTDSIALTGTVSSVHTWNGNVPYTATLVSAPIAPNN